MMNTKVNECGLNVSKRLKWRGTTELNGDKFQNGVNLKMLNLDSNTINQ